MKTIKDMKVESNKEIESLKTSQNEIKLEKFKNQTKKKS